MTNLRVMGQLTFVFISLFLAWAPSSYATGKGEQRYFCHVLSELISRNQAGAEFLLSRNRSRHTSPEVARMEALAREAGIRKPHAPKNKVAAWLGLIERTHRSDLGDGAKDVLKRHYYEKYVMAPEDVPESYFNLQKRLARERGHGDLSLDAETRRRLAEGLISDQKESIGDWVDYLLSPETSQYPMWAKVWVFEEMAKLRAMDTGTGAFAKRTKTTINKFPTLDRGALGILMDGLTRKVNKESLEGLDPEFINLLDRGNFSKLYAWAIKKRTTHLVDLSETTGRWVKYNQGSEPEELVNSLKCKNTGWCTEGSSSAKSQLQGGDFYVYFSNDLYGSPTQPRIAIRMNGDSIEEVRGIARDQNIDEEIAKTNILERKLGEFGSEGARYKKRTEDMKRLTAIEKKVEAGEGLSLEELRFLYEMDENIQGFGYDGHGHKRDPRVGKIRARSSIAQSLRNFPESVQKDFVRSALSTDRARRQLLEDKRSLTYLLILMREDSNAIEKLLRFRPAGKETKLVLESAEISDEVAERVIHGLGSRLDLPEILEIKNLLAGRSIQGDVVDYLLIKLSRSFRNDPAFGRSLRESLFSNNLELENLAKDMLSLSKNPLMSRDYSLDKTYELLIRNHEGRYSRDQRTLGKFAEDWLRGRGNLYDRWGRDPRSDLEKKADFILSFLGAKGNRYQAYLDMVPQNKKAKVLNRISEETSLSVFSKFAKSSGLSDELFDNGVLESFQFRQIQFPKTTSSGGEPFRMGTNLHPEVNLTESSQIQATPVTQLQWTLVMGENSSEFNEEGIEMLIKGRKVKVDPNRPVENISWIDIQKFIKKLNESQNEFTYRLPTVAEWRFAARAGSRAEFIYSKGLNSLKTQPVAELRANPFGLYDMSGNVYEWTSDWSNSKRGNWQEEGVRKGNEAVYRVIHGGDRYWHDTPGGRSKDVGFRLVRTAR